MKFCVPVVYRGLSNFIVEADTPEQAKERALAQFENGETPEPLGNEWEEVEKVGEVETVK